MHFAGVTGNSSLVMVLGNKHTKVLAGKPNTNAFLPFIKTSDCWKQSSHISRKTGFVNVVSFVSFWLQ